MGYFALSNYHIVTPTFGTGERFPTLVSRGSGQPILLATRYIIDMRRQRVRAATIEQDLRAIKRLYDWASLREIDLERRLVYGPEFTSDEVMGFVRYLRTGGSEKVAGVILPSDRDSRAGVLSPEVFNLCRDVVKHFIVWALRTEWKCGPRSSASTIEDTCRRIERVFDQHAIVSGPRKSRKGLSEEALNLLLEVIAPDAAGNPFNKQCRVRNYAMILLFLETGLRRGELLKLAFQDLSLNGDERYIRVVPLQDDPSDPRKQPPQAKTLGRMIPVSKTLAAALVAYFKETPKRRNRFVFISTRKGTPLVSQGVNEVINQVGRRFPELKFVPHDLRRTFHNRVLLMVTQRGWSPAEVEPLRRYLGGWSPNSKEPDLYAQQVIESQAMKAAALMQSCLYNV